jgi:aquaporin Z
LPKQSARAGSKRSRVSDQQAEPFDAFDFHFGSYWVDVAGPLLGAAIAVGAAFVLRGSGGGLAGSGAAQGALHTEAARPDQL